MAANIYQRINEVMKEAEYIKKGSAGQGTGVLYDEVIAMLRGLLTKNGIVIAVDFLADDSRIKPGKNSDQYIYEGCFNVSYINVDDPADRLVTQVVAHAMDSGDKAPGKAITYATKISMLKVFAIETGLNDEGRGYGNGGYTEDQKGQFEEALENKDALAMYVFMRQVGPDIYTSLYNSFEKGSISKNKKLCDQLCEAGQDIIKGYAEQITELVDSRDPAVFELTNELQGLEKSLVANLLDTNTKQYLKENKQ